MGNGRKRRRLERSPNSTSPSTAPSRRRKLDGETCVTEVEGQRETEVISEERQRETEQADGVVVERREGGGAVEGEKETQETKEFSFSFSFSFMNSLWDSLSNEEKWWSAHPDQVQKFARDKLKNPLLAELVLDMIKFVLIHDKLQFWFCPLCRVYFEDGDFLTMHLREQHFPMIRQCQAWLLPYQRDLKFASVQEAVCKMVWKPIDVERAVQQFYTLCLDSELEAVMGSQGELGWPLSDDDSERSRLLVDLGRELKALVFHKTGLLFLSSGLLQHLIAMASWHILIRLPSRDRMLHFARRLVCSPLSFRFLDKDALCHFIRVARRISQLASNEDLDLNSAASCILNEVSLPRFEISTLMPDQIHFFLKPAYGDYQGLRSWLHDKPSDIPCSGPLEVPSDIPPFLTHISDLSAACQQLTEILGESISCFNEIEVPSVVSRTSYCSTVSKRLCEALVDKGCSDVENNQLSDCFSKPALETMSNEYLTKNEAHSLRVVELFCELESWEFKVRRLCAFDFRSFLLPLMQRFFQSRSLSSKEICTEEFDYGDHRNKSSGFAGYTKLSDFQDETKEYNSDMITAMDACGTWDTNNSGLFFCVTEGDLMQVIDNWEIEDLVEEAISHARIHKTWRYWFCYICRERFANRESHMKHMDNEHKLSLPCDEQSGLIPRAPSKHEIDRLLGLEEVLIESSLKAFSPNEVDHMEKRALLTRMKELLYSILEKKPVLFSASSHLVHLAEFARVEFFRDLRSDKKNMVAAREIDESSQLVFSMLNARCLCRVVKFLESLYKQCIPHQMQSPESDDITRIASYGIFYADHKFQVDPAVAYFQAQETINEEELSFSKPDKLVEILERLEHELHSLRWHFNTKREVLGQLDVVFALDRMLMRESDHAGILRRRYEKLDSMDPAAQNSFQHHLISQVLHEDSSSRSFEEALEDEKDKLLSQLDNLDVQIMQELAQIDDLKRDLSELCFCDYSTYILPFIGVLLKPRIRLNAGIRYWANNRLQELLLSIDRSDLSIEPANFRITSVSIGKVLVNITASKWGLGFDYRGMRINFEGEWSFLLQGKRANGYIDFSGLSDWHSSRNEQIQAKSEVVVFIGGMLQNTEDLAPSLKEAVCAKLLEFQSEFVKESTPEIPTIWYDGDGSLPFPNEPFHGEGPMKYMNADCKKYETSEFRQLIEWKWMQWRRDMYDL